jgi:hypothetical protein
MSPLYDHLYVLGEDGRTPEPWPCTNEIEFGRWAVQVFGPGKSLARDDFPCGGFVSTIFLGIDLTHNPAAPVLFETLASNANGVSVFQHRETTYVRAMKTHFNVLQHVAQKALQ